MFTNPSIRAWPSEAYRLGFATRQLVGGQVGSILAEPMDGLVIEAATAKPEP
jgi:hypothetical protein